MSRKMACLAAIGLFFVSSAMAQEDVGALKQRVLSKVKACGCQDSLAACGDCSVAAEIKDYVDRLIEAKVVESKMLGYIVKSFGEDVFLVEGSKEEALRQISRALPADTARLDASSKSFDFGKVPRGAGEINREFILRNVGNKDLIIKDLRTSCACAKVSLRTASGNSPDFDLKGSGPEWKGTIKPGETAILEIVLDLAEFPDSQGPVAREAFFTSNDPDQSLSIFRLSLEITRP
jgi:hypothetical protein